MDRFWVTALAMLLSTACAGSSGIGEDVDTSDVDDITTVQRGRGEASVNVTYARTAKSNWLRAEAEFEAENYLAAQKYYGYIRAKFPYSAYALRADLRIADCAFGRDRFLEAIDGYQNFVRLHPTHRQVPYAMFKTGQCYFEQIPGDWFMLPPSHEKDQSAVRDAERALKAYVERYPKDENITEGKRLLEDVRKRLAAHERYAADFYENIEQPRARIGRLEVLRSKFADVALDEDLFVEMIQVRLQLEEHEKAKALLIEMQAKFPHSPKLKQASQMIATAPPPRPKLEPAP